MLEVMKEYEILPFENEQAFKKWLHKHYADTQGVWLKIAKKTSDIASIDRKQALNVALCYGWIDGQAKSVDENYYLQKFTPRRARSMWSKVNIGLVTQLSAEGKMQPAGQAAIDEAKADGRWEAAYNPPSTSVVPPEFIAALATRPKAKAVFETLNKTNRFAITWRIETARKPETRASRIEKIIAMLERGEKLH